MKKVIAIDGPSAAGKSTVSKEIAKILGFQYLNTGALYRAIAYYFLKKFGSHISDLTDEDIEKELKNIVIDYIDGKVFLLGENVSTLIREPEVGIVTSILSARKVVRDFLLPIQRNFAEKFDLVAEGRDMTTVVFPDVWKKFYLDASYEIRAKRRFEQLISLGKNITFEDALNDVIERNQRDTSRAEAPLKRAEDVFYIDTSMLSVEEVISIILKKVAEDD